MPENAGDMEGGRRVADINFPTCTGGFTLNIYAKENPTPASAVPSRTSDLKFLQISVKLCKANYEHLLFKSQKC